MENSGVAALGRRHPLTVQGQEIGSFDVTLSCGSAADQYIVTCDELRAAETGRLPKSLRGVELTLSGKSVPLKVVSSQPNGEPAARHTLASGPVPASLLKSFALPGGNSLTIETASLDDTSTMITLGNAGLTGNFPQLAASCSQALARGPVNLGQVESASVDGQKQ
jgi:hypothetical protein